MTKYLFFDTETSGLSTNWYASKFQIDAWPHVVQIAWIMCDGTGQVLSEFKSIIKPDGWTIEDGAVDVHGITLEYAKQNGKPIDAILLLFSEAIDDADLLIAHNFTFDENVAEAEFVRAKIKNNMDKKKRLCTMKSSVKLCQIPGNYGKYKYPTLSELYFKLFNEEFTDGHDALTDVRACARSYFELKRIGVI